MAFEISMARGDRESKGFTLKKKDGTIYSTEPDNIYFTVKKSARDHDYLFQKSLAEGTITFMETGKYQFVIDPEDTNELSFGEYDCDIEVVKTGALKRTFSGKLILEKEVTHYYNEEES